MIAALGVALFVVAVVTVSRALLANQLDLTRWTMGDRP
jgi:hypothetical protein